MAEQVHARITIKDPRTGQVLHDYETAAREPPDNAVRDLYKAHYAEAMSNYRFFGTLRAAIAWTPAVIAMTAVTYAANQLSFVQLWPNLIPSAFLLVVFLCIHLANRHLQVQQDRCLQIATAAQDAIGSDAPARPLRRYTDLYKTVRCDRGRPRYDPSSWFLASFLVVLLGAQTGFAIWRSCGQATCIL